MSTAYKILFSFTIRHDYYANKACNDFIIKPAPDCLEILNHHKLLFRQAGNKAIVLTPEKNGKPVLELAEGLNFRFYLFCDNPYFVNFTNWDQNDYRTQKFYACNQHKNFSEKIAYLTKPLSGYTDQSAYQQGSLVVNAQNEVMECLQVNPAGTNSKPLTDKKFWRKLAGNKTQYSTIDNLVFFSNNLLQKLMLNEASIKVESFENASDDFKTEVIRLKVDLANEQSKAINIFSQLSPNRYQLTINGKKEILYYDSNPESTKAWGFIEIHHQADLPADMQILDNGKLPVDENDVTKLKPRNYFIHFHNRSVLWKYNLRVMQDNYSIADNGAEKFSFDKNDASFISVLPIPVTEEPRKTFSLKKNTAAVIDVLKNPARDKVSSIEKPDPFDPETDPKKKKKIRYLCSEMYLTI